jgi:hypothetical protein
MLELNDLGGLEAEFRRVQRVALVLLSPMLIHKSTALDGRARDAAAYHCKVRR